jgi:arylsulfatase A-like enzyme
MDSQSLPNVLLVSIDGLRADHLSCYGYKRKTSPFIDYLASQGVLFERCIANASWTLPSHASLFTGKYPSVHGAHWEHTYLDEANQTIAEIFSKNEYITAGFISCAFLSSDLGLSKGFQYYYEILDLPKFPKMDYFKMLTYVKRLLGIKYNYRIEATKASRINSKLFSFLPSIKELPFFIFSHYYDCHKPLIPPRPYERLFNHSKECIFKFAERYSKITKQVTGGNIYALSQKDKDLAIDLYDGEIAYVDSNLKKLIQRLKDSRYFDNTIVIITADHGFQFGDHGMMEHCINLYNEALHVPLIMYWPKTLPAGKRIKDLVQVVDIMPTILELANLPNPLEIQGCSLLPIINEVSSSKNLAYTELFRNKYRIEKYGKRFDKRLKSLQTKEVKLIKSSAGENELYDLVNDPYEQKNIYNSSADQRQELEVLLKQLEKTFQQSSDIETSKDIEFNEKIKERLMGLGYID